MLLLFKKKKGKMHKQRMPFYKLKRKGQNLHAKAVTYFDDLIKSNDTILCQIIGIAFCISLHICCLRTGTKTICAVCNWTLYYISYYPHNLRTVHICFRLPSYLYLINIKYQLESSKWYDTHIQLQFPYIRYTSKSV